MGSVADVHFAFVDSLDGNPVSIPNLPMTVYDLDQGKKKRQAESITMCGADEAYVSSDSELKYRNVGGCIAHSSTRRGTGRDNPSDPMDITSEQFARAVTYQIRGKAGFDLKMKVGKGGKASRNFMFTFEPVMACGIGDIVC